MPAAVSVTGQNGQTGIFRSSDGGNTWTQVLTSNSGNDSGDAVIFDPSNSGVAYATLGNQFSGYTEGIYKSTDGGQTWTSISGSLPLSTAGVISLAMAPSNTSILYAGVADVNTGDLDGMFKVIVAGTNVLPQWLRFTHWKWWMLLRVGTLDGRSAQWRRDLLCLVCSSIPIASVKKTMLSETIVLVGNVC